MTQPPRGYQQDSVDDMITEITDWCEHHHIGLEDWQVSALTSILRGDMPTIAPAPRRAYAGQSLYDGLVALYYLKQQPGDLDD